MFIFPSGQPLDLEELKSSSDGVGWAVDGLGVALAGREKGVCSFRDFSLVQARPSAPAVKCGSGCVPRGLLLSVRFPLS